MPEQPGPLPVATSRARTPRFYYGWWIVAASAVVQMFQNALIMQAFGGYIVELEREFHWSKTLLSGASSMQQLQNGATGPFVGWLLDRVGPRLAIRIGVLLMGIHYSRPFRTPRPMMPRRPMRSRPRTGSRCRR